MRPSISKSGLGLIAALLVTACGGDEAASGQQPDTGEARAANVPQKDTGWQRSTTDKGSFRMERQLNQLTVFYELSPTKRIPVTVGADVFPCMRGKGNQSARENFTPEGSEDGDQLASVRTRFSTVLGKVTDRCDVPDETAEKIMTGFDGQFFQTGGKRRSVRPN